MTAPIAFSAAGLVGLAAFLALRLFPTWRLRQQGCDAYNILLCAEAIRRQRRYPPRLPGLFILEDESQWYPPVYLVLCALLPQKWLQQRYWLFNQLIDLANAALLFAVVGLLTSVPWVAFAATIAYAISAGLVREFAVLTTRPLGLLVLNLLVLAGMIAMEAPLWFGGAVAFGTLLIYAHKLSAQQTWVTLPVIFATTGHWVWIALLPVMYAAAFLVWPRGFREIAAGHKAIVWFWNRNWPVLGAHTVKQSPVYGDGGKTRQDFYAAWPGGAPLAFAKETLHQNYFVVPAVLGLVERAATGEAIGNLMVVLAAWLGSVYLMAAATHFIRPLRGLGLGRQYAKFGLLPSICLTAIAVTNMATPLVLVVSVIAALLSVRQYAMVASDLRRVAEPQATSRTTPELSAILKWIRDDADARVLVLPVHLCDLVAYETRRPVYWGTHGQNFDERLEQFFPVLRRRIEDYARDDNLNRLLLDTRYTTAAELGVSDDTLIAETGTYALYHLQAAGEQTDTQTRLDAHEWA